jgi:precorrin-3B synthase
VENAAEFDRRASGQNASGAVNGAMIKGWCPGALRPMESGDGLIVRLKITGGIVDIRLALEIARWSRCWGNGQIDLSARANLQLRGVSPQSLPLLQDALAAAGLLDGDERGEAVRNVISSPLGGLDPNAVLDVRPVARALEQRLASDTASHDLPGKFGFAIDDGGLLGLDGVSADICFQARQAAYGPCFDIYLAGAPDVRLGPCRPDALPDTACAIITVFLKARAQQSADIRRMSDLVAAPGKRCEISDPLDGCHRPPAVMAGEGPPSPAGGVVPAEGVDGGPAPAMTVSSERACIGAVSLPRSLGAEEIGQAAGLAHVRLRPSDAHVARPAALLGVHPLGSAAFVGIGLPFGRIAAEDLASVAREAAEHGARELRLTPWRTMLAPVPSIQLAQGLSGELAKDSFILDSADPRCRIAACPGAPDCLHATTPVRSDAAILAKQITGAPGSGTLLHVSGCAKGCAHPRAAQMTLVGRSGRYDLVLDGTPSAPAIRRNLTVDEAGEAIRQAMAHQMDRRTA